MISTRTAGAIALAAALAAGPALAQSTAPQGTLSQSTGAGAGASTKGSDNGYAHSSAAATGNSPALGANTADRGDTPSTRNSVLTDSADVRASKVIGSSVYNDHDEKIGSIDDILLDKDHKAAVAVVSVGGFLGIGSKLVEVPYSKLEFGDTRSGSDNKVKMPGATKDSLEGMPDYHYRNG